MLGVVTRTDKDNTTHSKLKHGLGHVIWAAIFLVGYSYLVPDSGGVVPVGEGRILANIMNDKRVHGLEEDKGILSSKRKPAVVARVTRCKRGDQ